MFKCLCFVICLYLCVCVCVCACMECVCVCLWEIALASQDIVSHPHRRNQIKRIRPTFLDLVLRSISTRDYSFDFLPWFFPYLRYFKILAKLFTLTRSQVNPSIVASSCFYYFYGSEYWGYIERLIIFNFLQIFIKFYFIKKKIS